MRQLMVKKKEKQLYKKKNVVGFKKGYTPWNKGLTKETDERIRTAAIHISEGLKELYKLGIMTSDVSDETKRKISKTLTGRTQTFETRKKKSLTVRHMTEDEWTGFSKRDKYGIEFRHARLNALKRDNHQCRCCATSEDLVVHHIDKNKQNNELENLITFCRSCHNKFHSENITINNIFVKLERGNI